MTSWSRRSNEKLYDLLQNIQGYIPLWNSGWEPWLLAFLLEWLFSGGSGVSIDSVFVAILWEGISFGRCSSKASVTWGVGSSKLVWNHWSLPLEIASLFLILPSSYRSTAFTLIICAWGCFSYFTNFHFACHVASMKMSIVLTLSCSLSVLCIADGVVDSSEDMVTKNSGWDCAKSWSDDKL